MAMSTDGSGSRARVPVASIGASAGGIVALQAFFDALPAKVGAAFVVIVHLDPEHASDLGRIIASRTKMPVVEVTDNKRIEADKIYVIPPNRRLLVSADEISSAPFDEPRGQRAPIDQFFRSVADQHGDGFAIILTGAGSDGALGVKAVKEGGGLILVQDPKEAEYPSMPRSAIASGVADLVLPVREIAARLPELVRKKQELAVEDMAEKDEETFRRILSHLRLKTGHDFSHYKRATVGRRLARRMQVIRAETLDEYLTKLRDQAEEVQALLGDLLISVTSFFRDPWAFEQLARDVIPKLFDERDPNGSLRIWVPGCATGEEVYSVAMLLLEEASRRDDRPEMQLFASDLDTSALATAREASYPLAIQTDVSEDRLRRFFTREGDHYRIRREVRDLVVFAPHSLLRDPPFSHIDLISCRNLLIYLDRDLQSQVCGTFHYALRKGGYLFVGSSESIDSSMFFRIIHRDARIFQSVDRARELPQLPRVVTGPQVADAPARAIAHRQARPSYSGEHREALEQLAPPSVLIDESHRILNLSESAGRYLLQPGGAPSNIAADVVRPELKLDLQAGLHRAFERNESTLTLPIAVQFNGAPHHVSLHVRPFAREGGGRSAIVVFMDGGPIDTSVDPARQGLIEDTSQLVKQLRSELVATQTHLRASREQYETVTEELRASNEELQSINEEYRSTAEELETSKEELQSINEELQTLNNELKLKLDAVSRAHNDLQNLMSATDVATLFLTPGLRINRFTPRVSDLFNVTSGDEGRALSDFTHRLEYPDLLKDARLVLRDLAPIERTIRSVDGHWLLMRLRPYRTLDDKIEGVVVSFVDVTERHEAEKKWEAEQKLLLRELSHRVKNSLAVVQAIVSHTLRTSDPATLHDVLIARLQALSRSHDQLFNAGADDADIMAIVRGQLDPYIAANPMRLVVQGPSVRLSREAAVPFGLLLHELATNASKYGSLSGREGRVTFIWETVEVDGNRRLRATWTENGGPAIEQQPVKAGFGSYLIDNALPQATVERQFRRDGFVCSIVLPLPEAVRRS
jgi:two-component system, chemotaxis family, CheB/CheR fusion protein